MELTTPLPNKITATVVRNGNHSDSKVIVIQRDNYDDLLKQAKNKFRGLKVKKFYFENGVELKEEDLKTNKIYPKVKLIASAGDDFVGFKIAEKNKDDISGTMKEGTILEGSGKTFVIKEHSHIEADAVKQLEATAKLQNMVLVVGLPDLHPGKDFPVGIAAASNSVLYPHLVGTDVGCGMSFYKTSIKNRKIKLDQWSQLLDGLESPWEGNVSEWLSLRGVDRTDWDVQSLGTIGGGNHFAELQTVEEVVDQDRFASLGLDTEHLYLLVHSGSRGFGESIFSTHLDNFQYKGFVSDSEEAKEYLKKHEWAVRWAKCNRSLIAQRFLQCITGKIINTEPKDFDNKDLTVDGSERVLDVCHNSVIFKQFSNQSLWLHRKGAAPSDCGVIVIPGSRGHYSYLVEPNQNIDAQEKSAYTLAHGAGRRLARGNALKKGKEIGRDQLTTTKLGSRVICERKELLFEEIPEAYKDIDDIIEDLKKFDLVNVIAIMKPLITYKTRVKVYDKVDHRK